MSIETITLTLTVVAAIMAAVLKVWPIVKALFMESAAFTKRMHDEFCAMRLEGIRQRLVAIETHEAEAKEAVRAIWSRLDTISDRMADNNASVLKAIGDIGR